MAMIKIDLITGFLGAGKTTFIEKYARWLMAQGQKIGILENDYGAVNVDRLLLQDLEGPQCDLEMIAGGCDADCHRRRFRTKLIAMGMLGYDRVLVEPSGIYDVDEFFDALCEAPVDRWYEPGSVIAILDAGLEEDLSAGAEYLLASEAAGAGCVVVSKAACMQLGGGGLRPALWGRAGRPDQGLGRADRRRLCPSGRLRLEAGQLPQAGAGRAGERGGRFRVGLLPPSGAAGRGAAPAGGRPLDRPRLREGAARQGLFAGRGGLAGAERHPGEPDPAAHRPGAGGADRHWGGAGPAGHRRPPGNGSAGIKTVGYKLTSRPVCGIIPSIYNRQGGVTFRWKTVRMGIPIRQPLFLLGVLWTE